MSPLSSITYYGNRSVDDTLRAMCSMANVDYMSIPTQSGYSFGFKNKGNKLVKITYNKRSYYLEPGEFVKIEHNYSIEEPSLPHVIALNGGVDE